MYIKNEIIFFKSGETIKVLILTLIALNNLSINSKKNKGEGTYYRENKLLGVKTHFQQNELQSAKTWLN